MFLIDIIAGCLLFLISSVKGFNGFHFIRLGGCPKVSMFVLIKNKYVKEFISFSLILCSCFYE